MDDNKKKTEPKMDAPVCEEIKLWSLGQREAFALLLEEGAVYFDGDWAKASLRPKLDKLVVGSSGMGKTFLVHAVAQRLALPVLRLTYNEWIVTGARETPSTVGRLHEFVTGTDRGIIYIDEVDKFKASHRTDWSTAVFGELLLLLDRSLQQPVRGVHWTPVLREKLRNSFWIIASGTWQAVWTETLKPTLGFQSRSVLPLDAELIRREIERSAAIPLEIFRRFSSELVVLPPATEDDYRVGAKAFELDRMAQDLGIELDYAEAARRSLGARWLEESLARLLRLARKQGKRLIPSTPVTAPAEVSSLDLDDSAQTEWDDIPF